LKKRPLALGAALLLTSAVLFLIQWKLDVHWGTPAIAEEDGKASKGPMVNAATAARALAQVRGPHLREPTLLEKVQAESAGIGQPTDDPDKVEADLTRWGQSLNSVQIEELREVIFLGKNSGDEVALALDLLGRSDESAAQEALTDYVLKGPAVASSEQGTFQLLALDGVIDQTERSRDPRALQRLKKESSDALISRRAAQALGALKGRNPWPRETDEKALREILEKTSR
jgi:hypothetical protein